MAEAVESALADKTHLIVEAGTGTGKTLAYLVPAISLRQARRDLHRHQESSGAALLQGRSFPAAASWPAGPLRVCYMKGRDNYACRQKIYDAEKEPVLDGLEEVADFQIIREWEKTTRNRRPRRNQDASRISPPPGPKSMPARDLCTGQKCPQFERCFITLMHQRAAGKRHHHRQSPPVLRRPGRERRRLRRRDSARLRRRDLRRSPRHRRRRRPVLRSLGQQLPVCRSCAATSPPWPHARSSVRRSSTASSIALRRSTRGSFFGLFGATEGRTGFPAARCVSAKTTEEIYSRLSCARWIWSRSQLKLLQIPARGDRCRWSGAPWNFRIGAGVLDGSGRPTATSIGWSAAAAEPSCKPRPSTFRNCWTNACSTKSIRWC